MTERNLVDIRREGAVFTARLPGCTRLDQSNHEEFGKALTRHFEAGPGSHLLVNFEGVGFISSAVLSELIHARRVAEKSGGTLRVCGLTPYVASVFDITHLAAAFRAEPDPEAALHAYNRDVEAGV